MVLCILQGPFIPAWTTLQRNWMPQGAERAWARRIVGQGNNFSNVIAPTLTPFLAVNFGWRSVPLVYGALVGAFGLWWHFTTSEHPPGGLPEPEETKAQRMKSSLDPTRPAGFPRALRQQEKAVRETFCCCHLTQTPWQQQQYVSRVWAGHRGAGRW